MITEGGKSTVFSDVVTTLDWQATALAVNACGSFAVLAGRKHLGVVDLEKSGDASSLRKIQRQARYDTTAIEWNPHIGMDHQLISTSYQHVDVWNLTAEKPLYKSIKGHTRGISDLNWSPYDSFLFVTCSADTYVYIWDMRETRKPAVAWKAVAGASQVKWNRFNENILASSHDGDIRIWDKRKSSTATTYIAAHSSKIHGLDWSPKHENILASASQDSTVKLWDVKSPRNAESEVQVGTPVWRAKFTPFGHGLVTVVVSQMRRSENSLLLWNLSSSLGKPIHAFVGHVDFVPDFVWRVKSMDDKEKAFQLVTWSKDMTLRQWKIDSQYLIACGHQSMYISPPASASLTLPAELEVGSIPEDSSVLPALLSPPPDTSVVSSRQVHTLSQEFSLLNQDIPGITVEKLDLSARTCQVSACVNSLFVRLVILFPSLYPNEATPSFQISTESPIDVTAKNQLIQSLSETAKPLVNQHRPCLEVCLRKLVALLERQAVRRRDSGGTQSGDSDIEISQRETRSRKMITFTYCSSFDDNIPFPRTCGGSFCSAGMLVVYSRPAGIKGPHGVTKTARSLAELSSHSRKLFGRSAAVAKVKARTAAVVSRDSSAVPIQKHGGHIVSDLHGYSTSPGGMREQRVSLRSYYWLPQSELKKVKGNHQLVGKLYVNHIVIYDTQSLTSVSSSLAEIYTLNGNDISAICDANAVAAASVERYELVRVWQLLKGVTRSHLVSRTSLNDESPWAAVPFGRQLVQSLMSHYEKLKDVQMLAMLTAVIALSERVGEHEMDHINASNSSFSGHQDTAQKVASLWRHRPLLPSADAVDWVDPDEEKKTHQLSCRLLDSEREKQYDEYKRAYGEILYCWGMLPQRCEVLKFIKSDQTPHSGLSFGIQCHHCDSPLTNGITCPRCNRYGLSCSICRIAVKGCSNFCLSCGHGGHTFHMMDWFTDHDVCPTGCGCHCIDQPSNLL